MYRMACEPGKPSRPLAVMPTMTLALAAAAIPAQQLSMQHSLASLANWPSAFTPIIPQHAPAVCPDTSTFRQLTQLFPGMTRIAQQQQRHWTVETSNKGGRSKSGGTMSSWTFASRHQAAEQRRRNRINDRCADKFELRLLHSRVAGTCFEQNTPRADWIV